MTADAVSLVIPVKNVAEQLPEKVAAWKAFFATLPRDYEMILVDYGSSDNTLSVAQCQSGVTTWPEAVSGFGAALRVGFAAARHPILAYTSFDYPYTPADLAKLLNRLDDVDPSLQRTIELVSGCRTGVETPAFWSFVGKFYRLTCRVLFGLPLQPPPGWLGFREHFRSYVVWIVFGDPLTDPNSAFKVFRRSLLDKFPIQCDGEFVHVELVAKATFTTCLMDEIPLTPSAAAVVSPPWREFWTLFNQPKFYPPAKASDSPLSPPVTAPDPVS